MAIKSISRPGARTPPPPAASTGPALFNLGFRPFYLCAALYAAVGIPLWLAAWSGTPAGPADMPPMWWHMHEMVFGFAATVVIGFLLTAARAWTGRPTPTGPALAGLVALWVLARLLFQAGQTGAAIAVEVLLIVLAAAAILRVLVADGNRRNYFVVVILGGLAAMDLAFALALADVIAWSPDGPLHAALYLIVMLTAVFGGRVVPAFTANALAGLRQYRRRWLDTTAVAAALVALLAQLVLGDGALVATLAAIAALAHAARLAGWNPLATRGRPILWIMHAAYVWMPIGFALLAAAALDLVPRPLALHAFSVGLIGGLIIAMITRTALGHTGRPLQAGRSETAMYALVMVAAVVRVFGPLLLPGLAASLYTISGLAWSAAFVLYLVVYGPRLSRPRIDGRPG